MITTLGPILAITCGPSGSGKTYFSSQYAKHHNYIYLSSDKLRYVISGDESNQSINGKVFDCVNIMLDYFMYFQDNIILDTTALTVSIRKGYIEKAKSNGYSVFAFVFNENQELCVKRDASRLRIVGSEVIKNQFNKYKRPSFHEGFDRILTIDGATKPDILFQ